VTYSLSRRSLLRGNFSRTTNIPFYREYRNHIPAIEKRYWALSVGGDIGLPAIFTYDELLAMPQTTIQATLVSMGNSVGGSLIGTATWTGVSMRSMLQELESIDTIPPHARVMSADGRDAYLRREQVESAIVALRMNASPLLPEYGAPARLIVPGLYDYKMLGWLARIEFTQTPRLGLWDRCEHTTRGNVEPTVIIQSPTQRQRVSQYLRIEGIAYAGLNPITRVEVSVDGYAPVLAQLAPTQSGVTTSWHLEYAMPTRGIMTIEAQAHISTATSSRSSESLAHAVTIHVE
jgi:DMSO/TMAO reductase YedYZ molybdopterin-dependent catalytic subunit